MSSLYKLIIIAIISFVIYAGVARGHDEVPYLRDFYIAEYTYDIPDNLLISLARAESGFQQDVIECKVDGPTGDKGIMQIVPKWHPDAEPCDPRAAIDYAGKYMRWLRKSTGSWLTAIAAYNYGIGNAMKSKIMPMRIRKYVRRVVEGAGYELADFRTK